MNISKIIIKGFRSFGPEVSIPIREKLTAYIGYNSSGKTTALEALRKVFGQTLAEREIKREDFHIGSEEDPSNTNEKHLTIEVQFQFNESDSDSIAHFFSDMVVDAAELPPYIRIRLEATWKESEIHQDGDVENKLYFITVPEGVTEAEDSKRMFPNHLRQLIQILYVPAIRKPADQIKYASGSMLYRVLRKIKWGIDFKKDFESKIKEVGVLFQGLEEFNTIQESITKFWAEFHKDPRFKDTNLGFGQSDFESVLKRIEVSFSPSGVHRPFGVDELGEGYRSLFYLTLVCALLEVEQSLAKDTDEIGITRPLLTLLAIEEPENHIAPQLLGRVTAIISKISKANNAQVFLSSHTPAIVKRIPPESICHFRIGEKYQTEVNVIILPDEKDEAYKFVKEAIHNFPEIYFAKLVVIGEGDSEEVVINRLTDILEIDFDDNLITFAPLGHRFVNHIWRLLRNLRIPFVTILDLDLERHGGGWGRIKYVLEQLILIGAPKEKLLGLSDGTILGDSDLEKMHTWKIDLKGIQDWADFLTGYNVFFSSSLDIDFLMLQYYPDFYKSEIPKNGGPRIPDKATELDKFNARLEAAVQATLKSDKAIAVHYTEDEKELMIWYHYLFLGRGKPTTHILTLSKMSKEDIKKNLPPVFNKLFGRIKLKLKKNL
ncbi:MAG: AAA family ATPase [Bacteroidetes bacterium]|nr:AAA family ATPase [Bacteroidota bacterium]